LKITWIGRDVQSPDGSCSIGAADNPNLLISLEEEVDGMHTLRAKLIALLAGAILLVVALATWLNWRTLGRPDFTELVKANATYASYLLGRVQEETVTASGAVARLQDAPAGGRLLIHFTAALRAELVRSGIQADAVVTLPTETTWPVVSLHLPGQAQKLVFPAVLPPRPPSTPPTALIGWL
jgi:hypothetical protein